MRKLSPAIIATAVALAVGSTAATAQLRTATGGAVGTNGSTATTSSGSTNTASGGTAGFTGARTADQNIDRRAQAQAAPASPAPEAVPPAFNSSDRPVLVPTPLTPNNGTGTSSVNSANTVTDVTANNANAAPVASALGTSPGQTSAGTAGASSSGLGVTGVTNPNLGLSGTTVTTANGTVVNANGLNNGTLVSGADGRVLSGANIVPGAGFVGGGFVGGTGFTGGMGDASGINANGERVGSGGADFRTAANVQGATPTPLFNQAAARGAARDAARRARGDEPRIIGLAPRTDRDLTHQMPDDPIIRY